jgi:hypothetical protein
VRQLDRQVGVLGGERARKAGVLEVTAEQLLGEGLDNGATGAGAGTDGRRQDLQVDAGFDPE